MTVAISTITSVFTKDKHHYSINIEAVNGIPTNAKTNKKPLRFTKELFYSYHHDTSDN